jgi:hypothetical protein
MRVFRILTQRAQFDVCPSDRSAILVLLLEVLELPTGPGFFGMAAMMNGGHFLLSLQLYFATDTHHLTYNLSMLAIWF